MSHYDTLGINKNATPDEIKKAFRKLAMKHHPDRGGDDATFKKINEAYDVLSDKDKKHNYDQFGNADPQWQRYDGPDFSDIFGDVFNQFRQQRRPARNADAVADVTVSLGDVYRGIEKILDLGYTKIKLMIPAGTRHGTNFHLAGRGPIQHANMPPGDLTVRVHVINPPEWDREGDNLFIRIEVDYLQALLGTEVEILHLNGNRIKIKVPKRSNPGSKLRMSNLGMPNPDNGRPGNLIAVVEVTAPSMTDTQLQRLEEFINKEK